MKITFEDESGAMVEFFIINKLDLLDKIESHLNLIPYSLTEADIISDDKEKLDLTDKPLDPTMELKLKPLNFIQYGNTDKWAVRRDPQVEPSPATEIKIYPNDHGFLHPGNAALFYKILMGNMPFDKTILRDCLNGIEKFNLWTCFDDQQCQIIASCSEFFRDLKHLVLYHDNEGKAHDEKIVAKNFKILAKILLTSSLQVLDINILICHSTMNCLIEVLQEKNLKLHYLAITNKKFIRKSKRLALVRGKLNYPFSYILTKQHMRALAIILRNCPLETLILKSLGIADSDIHILTVNQWSCPTLTHLDLGGNQISGIRGRDIFPLANFLFQFPYLKKLNLSNNYINDIADMVEELPKFEYLIELNLYGNRVSTGIMALYQKSAQIALKILNLGDCGSSLTTRDFIEAFSYLNGSLTQLSVTHSDKEIKAMGFADDKLIDAKKILKTDGKADRHLDSIFITHCCRRNFILENLIRSSLNQEDENNLKSDIIVNFLPMDLAKIILQYLAHNIQISKLANIFLHFFVIIGILAETRFRWGFTNETNIYQLSFSDQDTANKFLIDSKNTHLLDDKEVKIFRNSVVETLLLQITLEKLYQLNEILSSGVNLKAYSHARYRFEFNFEKTYIDKRQLKLVDNIEPIVESRTRSWGCFIS